MDDTTNSSNNFKIINFRGKECYIGHDTIEMMSYINSLVTGSMKGGQVSEKGHILIDENSATIYMLVDLYRAWAQQEFPKIITNDIISNTSTLWACAQRMGCEIAFVNAIKPKYLKISNKYKDEDLFRCFYCHQMQLLDAKKSICKFHDTTCKCNNKRGNNRDRGCCTIPFHSPTLIKTSLIPISFEDYCNPVNQY